jgi:YegS/Rv2252/BmrU family lipid kinase
VTTTAPYVGRDVRAGDDGPARGVLVLANPTAGGFRRETLDTIAAELARRGIPVTVHLTGRAGEIADICGRSDAAIGTVVVAGGDGSVNEAIAGFEKVATPPALAVVPFGTANVLAHELRLPFDPEALAGVIARRRTRPLYYGLANRRPFVLMVSAGFDAAVVHAVPLDMKRRCGKIAYAWTALRLAFRPRPPDVIVTADGERLVCRMAVVLKVSRYGGPFLVCPQASAARPELYLFAVVRDDPWAVVRMGLALLAGRFGNGGGIVTREVTTCRFESAGAVPCQIDGDTFGTVPVEIVRAPRPVDVIVP